MKIGEISLKQLQKMGVNELNSLYSFLENPSEERWRMIDMGRLCDERERLQRAHISKSEWPISLQPVDWQIEARRTMGLPPRTKEELERYVTCQVFVELFTEREILKVKEVPESEWPEKLQGSDWVKRLYLSYGLEEPASPPQNVENPIKDKSPIYEPRTKPKPPKIDNPFKDDGFGTILK